MEPFTFIQKYTPLVSHYTLYREERTQLQGIMTQNKTMAEVSLQVSKDALGEPVFLVDISDYKQSNRTGLYGWVQDLVPLRSQVIFSATKEGLLGHIRNHSSIKEVFDSLIPFVLKKHTAEQNHVNIGKGIALLMDDPERLATSWRYTAPYINLFPGMFQKKYSPGVAVAGYRELPNFIGIKQIPINTTEKLTTTATRRKPFFEIETTGTLATEKFDPEKMSALVRLLRNHPRVPTDITLRYNENHTLDEDYRIHQTVCMSLVVIPGFLYRQETTILKRN